MPIGLKLVGAISLAGERDADGPSEADHLLAIAFDRVRPAESGPPTRVVRVRSTNGAPPADEVAQSREQGTPPVYQVPSHQVDRSLIDQALTDIEGRTFTRWHRMCWGPDYDPEAFAEACDELLDHVAACARFDPALSGPPARAALRTAAECAAAVLDRRLWPNGDFEVDFPVLTARYGATKLTSPETSYSLDDPQTPPAAEWIRSFALCLVSSAFEVPWRRNLVLKFDVAPELHVSPTEPAAGLAEMDALADYLVDGDEPPLVVKPDRQARVRAALRLDAAAPLTPDQHLLRVLLDDAQPAFEQALADRLDRYREDIGDDPAPRTLLPLTAIALANLAVLAHGWRLDVRSGYLPEGLLPEPPR